MKNKKLDGKLFESELALFMQPSTSHCLSRKNLISKFLKINLFFKALLSTYISFYALQNFKKYFLLSYLLWLIP